MNTSSLLINTIALSLLHFLWQGAAIAALAGTLMLVLRTPATRYLVGVGALILMLFSFVATVALLSGSHITGEIFSARASAAALASPKEVTVTFPFVLLTSQAATYPDVFVWMARAWFAGVFVFALRIVFGLLAIERLRHHGLVALSSQLVARFEVLQARLGIERVIRFCRCDGVSVPAVIGVFRPVVLLPLRALTGLSAEQIDAVVAHELGHIMRFDVAVNFLQVIAETLLFFHPAVWWLNRRIRADREDCCDDVAVAACGDRVTYARALAAMEGWRETPSFAMAATGGTVAARVGRLLGVSRRERGEMASRGLAALLVLTMSIAAGIVSLGISLPATAQSNVPAAPPFAAVPAPEMVLPAPPVPELIEAPPASAIPDAPVPGPQVAPAISPLPAVPAPEVNPPPEPKAAKEPRAPKPPKEPKTARESRASREKQFEADLIRQMAAQGRFETDRVQQIEVRAEAEAAAREKTEAAGIHQVEVQENAKIDAHEEVQTDRIREIEAEEKVDVEAHEEVDVIQIERQEVPEEVEVEVREEIDLTANSNTSDDERPALGGSN